MRFFFRSRQFKIFIAVVSVTLALSLVAVIIGGLLSPQSGLLAAITSPFEKLSTDVGAFFEETGKRLQSNEKAILENNALKQEIADLKEQLAEYDEAKRENEFYKNYLELKEDNPEFQFADANVIARDSDDPFGGFVINKGSLNGVSAYDPVITHEGLMGYVTEVGLTTCKVTTILSSNLKVGALDSRTGDSGAVSGTVQLAKDGLCQMNNLVRTGKVAVGDYIVSSGEGIFPAGLLIGEITAINNDAYTNSLYASVKPFADIAKARSVMVITYFPGQGSEVVTADD